jgi:hypothetical protein
MTKRKSNSQQKNECNSGVNGVIPTPADTNSNHKPEVPNKPIAMASGSSQEDKPLSSSQICKCGHERRWHDKFGCWNYNDLAKDNKCPCNKFVSFNPPIYLAELQEDKPLSSDEEILKELYPDNVIFPADFWRHKTYLYAEEDVKKAISLTKSKTIKEYGLRETREKWLNEGFKKGQEQQKSRIMEILNKRCVHCIIAEELKEKLK